MLPALIKVLGAWPRLSTLNPAWFTVGLPVTPGGLGVVEASLSGRPCPGQLSAVTADPSGRTRRSGEQPTAGREGFMSGGERTLVPTAPEPGGKR